MIPTTSHSIWFTQKTVGLGEMTVGPLKLNEVVTSIVAALSDVVSLLEQSHTFPSAQRAALDLTGTFSSILVPKAQQQQLLLCGKASSAPSLSDIRGEATL